MMGILASVRIALLLGLFVLPYRTKAKNYLPLKIRSSIYELVAEQAKWRHWSTVYVIGGETIESKELMDVLSKKWIKSNYRSKLEMDFMSSEKFGYVCIELINSNRNRCSISTNSAPWLVVISKSREEQLKAEMERSSYVNFDSDIILAIYNESSFVNDEIWPKSIALQQAYKVHKLAKLTVIDLDFWKPNDTSPDVIVSDSRRATRQFKLRIGVKNGTLVENMEDTDDSSRFLTALVEKEEDKYIFELVRSLTAAINISYEVVTFARTGWQNNEGAWTHLIGAVADGQVDIGADTVDLNVKDIGSAVFLTNPVILARNCIYHKKSEGVRVRDVFTTTFSYSLRVSVLATIVLLWLAMLLVTFTSAQLKPASCDSGQQHSERFWSPVESLIWVFSVLCMQGSPWSPKSASGCLLLLFSLIFALIIFNSFAAFITSVLSVNDNSIKSVQDLLTDEFAFGYTKNTEEENFLRTTDDRQLLSLYYRGLVSGGGVADTGEGIVRTVAGPSRFAFFATSRLVRRAIHSVVPQHQRCNIIELAVPGTSTPAAIPIAKNSPYRNAFRFWLLRMRQTGILHRIKSQLLPPMPACVTWQQFTGVGASDLVMAFYTYLVGLCSSWIILVGELFWSKRNKIFRVRRKRSYTNNNTPAVDMKFASRHNQLNTSRPFWEATDYVN